MGMHRGRGAARVVCALMAVLVMILGGATSASAHAELQSSDPAPGEVRLTPPSTITLNFDDPLDVEASSVELLDDHLRPVTVGAVQATGAGRTSLKVSLPPALGAGTFTVTWRTSSEDTHPVAGTFQFSIGAPSVVTGGRPPEAQNAAAGMLLGWVRALSFAGLILGPGLLLVVLALWREGLSEGRVRRMLWTGLALLVGSTVAGMLLQGVWASGQPLSAIWTSPGALDTHSRRFDRLYAVRFYLVVAFGISLVAALARSRAAGSATDRRAARIVGLGASGMLSTALVSTWALAGHAADGSLAALAVAVNAVHLLAMTLWIGGLFMVTVSLMSAARAEDLARVLPQFSRLALTCVAVIVLSGTYLAWREVAAVGALTSTEYGRVLMVKLVGVLGLVVLGNVARRWVQRHLAAPETLAVPRGRLVTALRPPGVASGHAAILDRGAVSRLRRGLLLEVVIAAGVLALTAALVVIVPAGQEFASSPRQAVPPAVSVSTATSPSR